MSNQSKNPSSVPSFMWAIIAAVVVVAGIAATLIVMNAGNKNSANTPTRVGNNQPPSSVGSDCSHGGPCTGLSNGSPGCSGDGPCTQDSNGQTIIVGTVVSVNSSSITIKSATGGGNQTFGITSGTKQNKGGGSGDTAFNANDVKVGGDVGIVPSSSNKTQAQLVMLNLQSKMESGSGSTGVH